ncbi:hypothetical protein LSCM1_06265 [Leishmania martiniquensis]|uniref:Uncharacterized protein n=1 Tax=Leishmania martiniquensis TaxID=1580590 RepID=A0A836KN65_9TRYP|nr:hypothetical protein LSCM1_06265 [Leishmania martiniquensis]
MDRVQSMLSALMPTLEKHQMGSWKPAEVERLCRMLRNYGNEEQREGCDACGNSGTTTAPASFPSPSCGPSSSPSRGDNVPGESDADEEAFVGAVEEVDRCLDRVRDFLKQRMPFGVLTEPTAPASATQLQAPQLGTVDAASKKRARSPCAEALFSAAASSDAHNGAAVVAAPVYAVDAFLYSEDDIEELVKEKKVSREYCRHCGGTDLGLTEFITHSLSQDQLLYLSCFLFPHLLDEVVASDETSRPLSIVDVGSRLGVVLWACAFSLQWGLLAPRRAATAGADAGDTAADVQLVGVEVDAAFVKISQDVVRRFFAPRRWNAPTLNSVLPPAAADGASAKLADVSSSIRLLQNNCFDGAAAAALSDSSLVVMHNVFEYFCATVVEHAHCWLKLRRLVHRSGQLLVCSPALEETLGAFTEEVWSQALELEKGTNAGDTSTPLAWLTSYVEPLDTADVASAFLRLRGRCRGGLDIDSNEDPHDEDCHAHELGGGHHHYRSSEEEEGEERSELAEQIQGIYVYRVK